MVYTSSWNGRVLENRGVGVALALVYIFTGGTVVRNLMGDRRVRVLWDPFAEIISYGTR